MFRVFGIKPLCQPRSHYVKFTTVWRAWLTRIIPFWRKYANKRVCVSLWGDPEDWGSERGSSNKRAFRTQKIHPCQCWCFRNTQQGMLLFNWADQRWKALVILESDTSVSIALVTLAMFVLWSVAQTCLAPCNPWTGARQAPLSLGFSRQEHWSGSPWPPPGVLPNPEVEPRSPALQILDQLSPQGSSLARFKTPQKTKGKYSHITSRQ